MDDRADVCPGIADPQQADVDADGAGDLCDNCVFVRNPRLTTLPGWAVVTGGQRDDDADGRGNVCDGDFDNSGLNVGPKDTSLMRSAVGHHVSEHVCGSSETESCARYDLDDSGGNVGPSDVSMFRNLLGLPLLPEQRCPSCRLPCTAGSARSCP